MQVSHAIRERRSARAFLPEPVDAETVGQILDLAKWAPSWANSQGWSAYVLTGESLEGLKAAIAEKIAAKTPPAPDIPAPADWPDYLAERMVFRRPPAEAPGATDSVSSVASVWEFYGAPCLILLAVDDTIEPAYACFDAGLFAQTLCLAAEDRGFATCVMATAVRYGELLHEHIPQAEDRHFVVGIGFGFIDHTAVVNRSERNRVEIDDFATFLDEVVAE